MSVAIALLTRDLRVCDNPVLDAAARAADRVVPLFVLDEAILRTGFNRPNRARFLAECLGDLDESLTGLGAGLVVRRGDVVAEVARLAHRTGAAEVFAAADVSGYAQRRQRRLADGLGGEGRCLRLLSGVTVVPPGRLVPEGKDHSAVFTPYFRKWAVADRRALLGTPRRLCLPDGLDRGHVPDQDEICPGTTSPRLPRGGEGTARALFDGWLRHGIAGYDRCHDDLAADATSRLSPYLHFGCLSPTEAVVRCAGLDEGRAAGREAFVRQLAWRDFHHQVLAARPDAASADYRPRGRSWSGDDPRIGAWREGRTGIPVVDAGMRQLAAEGWMHNRARLIVAAYLTRDLAIDWRLGARHFFDLLVDGDLANNTMNWQWVAGTGNDTRRDRPFNVLRQAARFDPTGEYVRRHVEELTGIDGPAVHRPWRLDPAARRTLGYPEPLTEV
ncbi:cryptochrome/photolyase family protein [Actinomadura sp. HBU206391]|uniref:cryptochrome/photolyase family protein n=1 Tax=Actinomadura sp. HBU206391 TaxID=2731692 RepID=UPI00164F18EA|nr:deoxyribodipyrimidine photo-lyase [Actinomadura sp. HBU206391]MBC6459882.1 deoxyribodipyrimidine photo-lyase [Actinomadura sp. HBU206391]